MAYAGEVFERAAALIDELDETGSAYSDRTEEYALRAPSLLHSLSTEVHLAVGERAWYPPCETLDDALEGIEENYALGVMPYGLAAALLADENPTLASFMEARYEELRERWLMRLEAIAAGITDEYGGLEYGDFGRW